MYSIICKIFILEAILSVGTEINKIVPKQKEKINVKVENLILTVDRCEKIWWRISKRGH